MKLKFKFPKLKFSKRKKVRAGHALRATAARRPMRATAADYEELAEPNMRLSRALLIVLILHVVAVSGIIAFNAIKTREKPVTLAEGAAPPAKSLTTSEPSATPVEIRRAHSAGESQKTYTVAKGDNPANIAKKLKVPYDELIAINHIDDPRKLKIGQKLLVPSKTVAKAKKIYE